MPRLTRQYEAFIEYVVGGYKPREIAATLLRDGRSSHSSIDVRMKRRRRTGRVYPLSTGVRHRIVPAGMVAYTMDVVARRSTAVG
ncbi:MAG: hypothetical protein FE78DRAFT_89638 [Acidomyces sp. 'richmondensis']|nr:MAG: hypothetical protein FE78DRAFT_89638 [Acidomyces sp. 'richmondensis']